jgi:hypothetical protein
VCGGAGIRDVGFPLVTKVMDGINAAAIAYGPTGSGKTHTMLGFGEDSGLIPRAVLDLFACVPCNGGNNAVHNNCMSHDYQTDSSGNIHIRRRHCYAKNGVRGQLFRRNIDALGHSSTQRVPGYVVIC